MLSRSQGVNIDRSAYEIPREYWVYGITEYYKEEDFGNYRNFLEFYLKMTNEEIKDWTTAMHRIADNLLDPNFIPMPLVCNDENAREDSIILHYQQRINDYISLRDKIVNVLNKL